VVATVVTRLRDIGNIIEADKRGPCAPKAAFVRSIRPLIVPNFVSDTIRPQGSIFRSAVRRRQDQL